MGGDVELDKGLDVVVGDADGPPEAAFHQRILADPLAGRTRVPSSVLPRPPSRGRGLLRSSSRSPTAPT